MSRRLPRKIGNREKCSKFGEGAYMRENCTTSPFGFPQLCGHAASTFDISHQIIEFASLKTFTSWNTEVRPFFLGDNSI